jgi:DNA-binding transcriptional LysR family regulator
MARNRSPLGRFEDVARFAYVADRIVRDGASMREIARDLNLSTTAIRDCIARLDTLWNCSLLMTRQGSSEANQLSPDGLAFYERFAHFLRHGATEVRPINVHISHSLLTGQLLTPAISAFLLEVGDDYRQRLRLQTRLDFPSVIRELQTGALDVALFWGLPSLDAELPRGIECLPTELKFDLVAISHTPEILDQYVINGELHPDAFKNLKFVTIDRDRQPLPLNAPLDWMHQGESTEVDTFDAVLALVRSRVGDFGCLPANYLDLDRYRVSEQLYWQKLASRPLQVAFYLRQGGKRNLSADARQLVNRIESHLAKAANSGITDPSQEARHERFHDDPAWFEAMRFAYFLDFDRDRPGAIKWKWETVLLQRKRGRQATDQYQGLVKNCDGAVFSIMEGALLGDIFYLAARQIKQHRTPRAVDSFVSIFSSCIREQGIMSGVWGGVDASDRPAAYGTIWSHTQLSMRDLTSIASRASVTLVLNSAESHEFSRQPMPADSHLEMLRLSEVHPPETR